MTDDDELPPPDDPRQALKDELWSMGVPDAQAEAWIERWEAEAGAIGVAPDDPAYWRLASAWIDEAREAD
jgi:hypothetical protein